MILFLLTFLSVYSLMHVFFYSRVRILLPEKWPFSVLLALFLALMVFMPIWARLLERNHHHVAARIAATVGYPWMGFLFYAFWCFLLLGIAGALFRFVQGAGPGPLSGKTAALLVLGAVLLINVYGFFEARSIRVERIAIRTGKLPEGIDRLRIAQISDIHLGLLTWTERLDEILGKVRAENPDILVSTGDLVDGDMGGAEDLRKIFETVRPRLGKYAVTGNHEAYAGLAESIQAEESFGFTLLRGEGRKVENAINIAGIDDPATGMAAEEGVVLDSVRNGLFTLFLKHRPEVRPASLGKFDLQLSGHTHYGQLFPFRYFVRLFYPLLNGPYYLEKGSVLYTSRGSGTWGPPIRVLAPPEITVIDLIRE